MAIQQQQGIDNHSHYQSTTHEDTICSSKTSSTASTISMGKSNASSLLGMPGRKVSLLDRGYPGFLSQNELEVYEQFRDVFTRRDASFRSAVYCFGDEEEEAHALCRWLRARKYSLVDVIQMVEEAVEMREEPGKHEFFPNPHKALGCSPSLYVGQYPQLYTGHSKEGYPIFISKPGVLNVRALECITSLQGIINFHWNAMSHVLASRNRLQATLPPYPKRFECICVLDLAKLSASQITKRALNIIKIQTEIDSLCFPETLNRMLVINAPGFFSLTWKLIKGWVDQRTASKVEIFGCNPKKYQARLLELVNPQDLPSDYGGVGKSTKDEIDLQLSSYAEKNLKSQKVEYMDVRSKCMFTLNLGEKDLLTIKIHTRSLTGAKFSVVKQSCGTILFDKLIKHHGEGNEEEEDPTCIQILDSNNNIKGPGIFEVHACSISSSYSFSSEQFVAECLIMEVPVLKCVEEISHVKSHEEHTNHHNESIDTSKEVTTESVFPNDEMLISSYKDLSFLMEDVPLIDIPSPVVEVRSHDNLFTSFKTKKSTAPKANSVANSTENQVFVKQKLAYVIEPDIIPKTNWLCGNSKLSDIASVFTCMKG